MLDNLLLVSKQVGVLFVLTAVGCLCNRCRLLNGVAIKGVTGLLMLIVTPCVIIHSFIQQRFSPSLLGDLGWALAVAVFAHVIGSAIALICLHDRDARREGVLRFAAIFSNAGFMGLPLEYAILGADGVFFGAMYVVVFNLVCWTWGVAVMCRGAKATNLRSILVNPGTVGVALGLPFFLFSVNPPEVVGRPIQMLADLNTPLAMIMVGWYLAEADLRPVLCRGVVYGVAALRLLVVPLAVIGALVGLRACVPTLNPVMAVAIATAASAPVAALTTVIAARFDRDVTTATGLVSGTTLLSILTMPPIVGFALWLFGR
ncbi:MAG: AEC family transporter [Kiritimatiellae bacterium]|nr:AEC family transporter [Kiritimatiellia bacterium]